MGWRLALRSPPVGTRKEGVAWFPVAVSFYAPDCGRNVTEVTDL